MLPSLGFNEILIIGVLALLVIGPKDLPLLLRKLGRWTAKLRGMAQEFRTGFDELARQAELDELKREVDALRRSTNLASLANEITKPLPTLEDYAGVKPTALPASASPSMGEASREAAGGGEPSPPTDEPQAAQSSPPQEAPPPSSQRDDSSSIEEAPAFEFPEGADRPVARSAP